MKTAKIRRNFYRTFMSVLNLILLVKKSNIIGFIVVLKNKNLKAIHTSINRVTTENDLPIAL